MKLVTDKPGDGCEREADRVAAQMSDLSPNRVALGVSPPIQRSQGEATGHLAAAPFSVGRALAGPGDPLEPALRQDMECGFGRDFSRVRVHAGPDAERSTQDIRAQAYTVGNDLVFAAGRFAPGTHEGRRLIAHELTHVVQQHGAMPVVQRAPATDIRWTHDQAAARYRGRQMARRIKNHGKLSKEARAKINKELAYFQGSANDAYLNEVRPALRSVTEIEMPEERLVPQRPRPIRLSLLEEDARLGSFTDDQIYAPLKEAEQRDKDELAEAQAREMEKLKQSTAGWGADQAFALELLRAVLERTTNVDPRAVSDKTREPILSRYRDWLTAVDKNRHEACLAMPSGIEGLAAKSRARFQNDDPCVSWFADSSSHGPSQLDELGRILTLNRNSHTGLESPADVLHWDIFEYRKKTDPSMLEQERIAGQMVGALGNLAGMPGEGGAPGGAVPPEEVSPGGTVIPPTEGKGVPAEPSVSPEQPTEPIKAEAIKAAGSPRVAEPAGTTGGRTGQRAQDGGRAVAGRPVKPRTATATKYVWNNPRMPKGNFIEAELDADGALTITVKSQGPDELRVGGSQMLDDVFDHFGADKIRAFDAQWVRNSSFRSNYDEYAQSLLEGMKPEEAAWNTWTGRQLKGRGFTSVEVSAHGEHPDVVSPVFKK